MLIRGLSVACSKRSFCWRVQRQATSWSRLQNFSKLNQTKTQRHNRRVQHDSRLSSVPQGGWLGSSHELFVLREEQQSGARKRGGRWWRVSLACQCHWSQGKMRAHARRHTDVNTLITWAGPFFLWRQTHGVLWTTGQTGHHRQRSGRRLHHIC